MDLSDRIALVTGAGSGIGRATARRLASLGAQVAVVAHKLGDAEAVAHEIANDTATLTPHTVPARPFAADLADPDSITALFTRVAESYDHLDILVANAGINGVWAPLDDLTLDEWTHTLSVNLTGTFLTVKHALPLLRPRTPEATTSIVITSSVNGTRIFSNTGATAYAVSKAGQVAFAKMTAVELARDHIRVNVVCPGSIETEIDDNTEQRGTDGLRIRAEYPEGQIPLTGERSGTADQVAELICFLASDAAAHITGTEVWIDGAQSLLVG